MEYIVYLLVLFVSGSFLLKVSFYPLWGKVAVAVAGALFMGLVTPWITELPPTWMTRFITYRPQLLDFSVCITLEAAIMIGFASAVLPPPSGQNPCSPGRAGFCSFAIRVSWWEGRAVSSSPRFCIPSPESTSRHCLGWHRVPHCWLSVAVRKGSRG